MQTTRTIPETDWKKLRTLKTQALNDACKDILDAVEQLVQHRDGGAHAAYLELWKLLQKRDEVIAELFDDSKRSTAFFRLAMWRQHGLVSDSDLALFTEETQTIVRFMHQGMSS